MVRRTKQHAVTGNDRTADAPQRAASRMMPTLMDRLRDDAPHRLTESPNEYALTQRQMRDIVQRDLAYLLNTISIEDQIDREQYPEAAASTINFGVPPLAGAFSVSHKWEEIRRMIRLAITDFEPRLIAGSLTVTLLTDYDARDSYNTLLFEVRGLIRMDPYPLEFLVQSSLDLETGGVRMTG